MADKSFVILQKKADRRCSQSNAVMGNKSGSSGNRDSLELKSMDSTRIRGAEIIDTNQEHKKRCFEKLVVRTERLTKEKVKDVKCSLQVEVIDDTALIEATAAVSGFKNSNKKETDVRSGNIPENLGGKQENDVKKRRNKGSKKQGKAKEYCSTKCLKEKKLNFQVVEDQNAKDIKIPYPKRPNGFIKTYPKLKVAYRRRYPNKPHQKVETENAGSFQEPDLNLNASKELEKESTIELVETESVIGKDEGLDSNPKKNEEEDEKVSKKMAYSREEIEALRFLNEDEQKNKWAKIYDGFSPSVAKEYTTLLFDMNKPQMQRYNRVANCGSTSGHHAILSMPPVLPLCSSSSYKKIANYGHAGFRVNFP